MPLNPFELPKDRLASTSEDGERLYIYPATVKGRFKTYRNWVHSLLIALFLLLPWLKIGGHQAVLLNVPGRRFAFFGLTFWSHEAPLLFLVILTFIIGIGLVTALLGRLWCGWACPQTVFIERLFRSIEQWIEGAGTSQRRFHSKARTSSFWLKKAAKWGLFFLISLVITHSFLAYFVGSDRILSMITQSPQENWGAFLLIVVTTSIILFDFGWFREQFCIVVCPYGRLQSVMIDEQSLVVGYDAIRGEPRRQDRHDTAASGDCINCYRCVQVCPTGIDIRRGTQLECVMCTACIDACDTVMSKLGKPKGLVRYDSEAGLNGQKRQWLRGRIVLYILLFSAVVAALSYALYSRDMAPAYIKRLRTPPYELVDAHRVRNRFIVSIKNLYFEPIEVELFLSEADQKRGVTGIRPVEVLSIQPGESGDYIFFVEAPSALLSNGRYDIPILLKGRHGKDHFQRQEVFVFVGP